MLIKALSYSDNEEAKLLILAGANVNETNESNESPIYWASNRCKYEIIKLLLERGANPNVPCFDGTNPLYWATFRRDSHLYVKLLLKYDANPNVLTGSGDNPLMDCVIRNEYESVLLLLKYGTDPNTQNQRGETALMCYFNEHSEQNLELFIILLKCSDLNIQNREGKTALMMAVTPTKSYNLKHTSNNRWIEIKMLLDAGADPTIKTSKGKSALSILSNIKYDYWLDDYKFRNISEKYRTKLIERIKKNISLHKSKRSETLQLLNHKSDVHMKKINEEIKQLKLSDMTKEGKLLHRITLSGNSRYILKIYATDSNNTFDNDIKFKNNISNIKQGNYSAIIYPMSWHRIAYIDGKPVEPCLKYADYSMNVRTGDGMRITTYNNEMKYIDVTCGNRTDFTGYDGCVYSNKFEAYSNGLVVHRLNNKRYITDDSFALVTNDRVNRNFDDRVNYISIPLYQINGDFVFFGKRNKSLTGYYVNQLFKADWNGKLNNAVIAFNRIKTLYSKLKDIPGITFNNALLDIENINSISNVNFIIMLNTSAKTSNGTIDNLTSSSSDLASSSSNSASSYSNNQSN